MKTQIKLALAALALAAFAIGCAHTKVITSSTNPAGVTTFTTNSVTVIDTNAVNIAGVAITAAISGVPTILELANQPPLTAQDYTYLTAIDEGLSQLTQGTNGVTTAQLQSLISTVSTGHPAQTAALQSAINTAISLFDEFGSKYTTGAIQSNYVALTLTRAVQAGIGNLLGT